MTLNWGQPGAEIISEWHGFWRWVPNSGLEIAVHWRGRRSNYLRTMNVQRSHREGVWVWVERGIALTQIEVDDAIDNAIVV